MRPYLIATASALALSFSAGTLFAADSPGIEQRLKQLEDQVKGLVDENANLRKQLGVEGKEVRGVVKPGGKEQKISLGGLIQAQGEFGQSPDARFSNIEDRFLLRRARLSATGSFAEQFDFRMEGEFGAGSISETTGYRAQLTDLFVNWNRFEFANVKVGQFKTPLGYEQLVSDPKLLTVERSLPNDRLTDGRQIGVGLSGNFLKKRLGYSAGVFNGTSVNNSFNDSEDFLYVGRVFGTPVETKWGDQTVRWVVGANALASDDASISKTGFGFDSSPAAGVDNIFVGHRTTYGVDSQLALGPLGLEAEYLRARFTPRNRVPQGDLDAQGWYVTGTYMIWPKYLQALARFESFDPNVDRSGDSTDVWTLGLTYFIKGDDLKLMVNYIFGSPSGGQQDQGRLMLRFQMVF